MPAILKYTRNYYLLEENEIATIKSDRVEFCDMHKLPIKKEIQVSNLDMDAAEKGGYEHFMLKEIFEQPEVFKKNTFIMLILVAFLGLMFFGMIAPIKGVWDICVDENDVTVIKAFFYKRHWKISDISYCKRKRGGMNVYVNGRKKKAFFVDGMTDHFDNFIKRMEKEGKEIILPETKEKR